MSNLLNLSPADFCEATKACAEGREWALTQPTMVEVWDNCPRADWLLWISDKIGQRPDDRALRLFAVWCVKNTPLADGRKTGDLLTDPRSLAALEVAERYAEGRATNEELAAARDAAWTAAWTDARTVAWADGVAAAWTDARTVAWADGVAAARYAARTVAWADGWAAARDATFNAVWTDARAAQAAHLRTLVPNPFMQEGKQ